MVEPATAETTPVSQPDSSQSDMATMLQADLRSQHFQQFLRLETNCHSEKLAILDRGIALSPYNDEVGAFAERLKTCPDECELVSGTVPEAWHAQPYPCRGQRPAMNEAGLTFLHDDIQQACVCVGQWCQGQVETHWLGRNAMKPIELWSTTKLVPILNVLAQANQRYPDVNISECQIRGQGDLSGYRFYDLCRDIMSYEETVGTSNAIAAMLKLFETPEGLEHWLKSLTGNDALEFRGRYGEPPFLDRPELWHPETGDIILQSRPVPEWSDNTISVYDLTRLISMVGWHAHLPSESQLPGIQWNSLSRVIEAMGCDSARYIDMAIAQLGLESVVRSPVILSKLGYGRTSIRDRAELAYTALVQFVDERPKQSGKPSILHSMAFTLLSAKDYGDFDKEAVELDARMATEVTELIRRWVQSAWDLPS